MRDRKTYSLNSLSDWIRDSVTSEATPEEIHAVIISSIQNEKDYHESCIRSANRLLELFDVISQEEIAKLGGYEWTPDTGTVNKVSQRRVVKDMDAL
jgi:hypothetical protein|tara:strand:- start:305 stop:595 length:291 start_codon:yes stop_codon:yes gene_type:complete